MISGMAFLRRERFPQPLYRVDFLFCVGCLREAPEAKRWCKLEAADTGCIAPRECSADTYIHGVVGGCATHFDHWTRTAA